MKAKINFDGNWHSEVDIKSYRFSKKVRFQRSLKTFLIFFSASILSALVPVLHFFSVPILLILSVYLSCRKFKEIQSLEIVGITCPECKMNMKDNIVGLTRQDVNIRLGCDQCRKNLILILDDKIELK